MFISPEQKMQILFGIPWVVVGAGLFIAGKFGILLQQPSKIIKVVGIIVIIIGLLLIISALLGFLLPGSIEGFYYLSPGNIKKF